jgi:hypothetical protein
MILLISLLTRALFLMLIDAHFSVLLSKLNYDESLTVRRIGHITMAAYIGGFMIKKKQCGDAAWNKVLGIN